MAYDMTGMRYGPSLRLGVHFEAFRVLRLNFYRQKSMQQRVVSEVQTEIDDAVGNHWPLLHTHNCA